MDTKFLRFALRTPQQSFDQRQISRHRHLRVWRHAGNQPTGCPINSHAAVSSVKTRFCCRAAEIARRITSTRKRLRRLHRPEFAPVEGAGNRFAVAGFLDGVRYSLRGDGGAGLRAASMVASINASARAGPGRVLDRHNFNVSPKGLQSVPNRVLSFRAAGYYLKRLLKMEFFRELREGFLHSFAHDQNNFVHAFRVVEFLPSVRR